jgi:cytochrome P450
MLAGLQTATRTLLSEPLTGVNDLAAAAAGDDGCIQPLHTLFLQDYHMLSNNVAVRACGSSTARDAAAAQEQLTRYMHSLVSEKEKRPSNDLISEVVQSQLKAGKITKDQLVAHAFLLLVAGACQLGIG